MTWQVVGFAAVCALFALIALSILSNWAQNIYIARVIGSDPRNDTEAAKAAAEQVRKTRP